MPRLLRYSILHRGKEVGAVPTYSAAVSAARRMNDGVGAPTCICPLDGCGAQFHLRIASAPPARDVDHWRALEGPVTLGRDASGYRLAGVEVKDPLAVILAARVEELAREASFLREDLRRAAEGGLDWLAAHPEVYGEERRPC